MLKRVLIVAATAALLGGCAASAGQNVRWVRAGASTADFEADKNRCIYEATAATPDPYMGGSAADMFGSAMMNGARQAELAALCMKAKGWERTVNNQPAA